MIRRLRVAHRRVWAVLALVVPALTLVALLAREPVPRVESWPEALTPAVAGRETESKLVPILEREGRLRIIRSGDGWSVSIERPAGLAGSEVLVLWSGPDRTEQTLGSLRGPLGVVLPLPPGAEAGGRLVFRRLAPAPFVSVVDLTAGDFEDAS